MIVNPFDKINCDCLTIIMSTMPISSLYAMSQTCVSFHKIFEEVFKENRNECRLLLESGKKYVIIVEPCILELKTELIGSLLLHKDSFSCYAQALSKAIAECFAAPALNSETQVSMEECRALLSDESLLGELNAHGFSTHLAKAFLEKYNEHQSSQIFYLFCNELVTYLAPAQAVHTLATVFEELYAEFKLVTYDFLIEQCKKTPEFAETLKESLKASGIESLLYLFDMNDVEGLVLIEESLLLLVPERKTMSQRLAEDAPTLFKKMASALL